MQEENIKTGLANTPSQLSNPSSESFNWGRFVITQQQARLLSQFLPKRYSLQICQQDNRSVAKNRPIRGNVQRKRYDQEDIQEGLESQTKLNDRKLQQQQMSKSKKNEAKVARKTKSMIEIEEIENSIYAKYNNSVLHKELVRKNIFQGLDEDVRPCIRLLNTLKNSKTSWAFREPVDVEGMGISHYNQIIKEPMDLSKVEKKLKNNQYATPTQFHADINKIIQNSYLFNQNNPEYYRITSEFQHFYKKTIGVISKNEPSPYAKTVQKSSSRKESRPNHKINRRAENEICLQQKPMTLAQKKQLSQNIRKLDKEYIKGLVDIVYEREEDFKEEIDLEELPARKIRQLQVYVREKLFVPESCPQSTFLKDENIESEFEMDSDEDS